VAASAALAGHPEVVAMAAAVRKTQAKGRRKIRSRRRILLRKGTIVAPKVANHFRQGVGTTHAVDTTSATLVSQVA